jgi:hypothetical protein
MEKHKQWRAKGQKMLSDAKKEVVAIQLDEEYQERIMEAYNEVIHGAFLNNSKLLSLPSPNQKIPVVIDT